MQNDINLHAVLDMVDHSGVEAAKYGYASWVCGRIQKSGCHFVGVRKIMAGENHSHRSEKGS